MSFNDKDIVDILDTSYDNMMNALAEDSDTEDVENTGDININNTDNKTLYLFEVLRPKKLVEKRKYDVFNGFIICCADETIARNTHPDGYLLDIERQNWYFINDKEDKIYVRERGNTWIAAKDVDKLVVRKLGYAMPNIENDIIMSDFTSG